MANKKSSSITLRRRGSQENLLISDDLLHVLCANHSEGTLINVPQMAYWRLGDDRKMNRPVNICGYQQRAFDFYWCLRALVDHAAVAVSIGAGGIGAPNCLLTDKYNGTPPPEENNRYGEPGAEYSYSNMFLDADESWPYYDRQFGAVIFNHSFEHLDRQEHALQEALRVTRTDGYVCIVMPDMTYNERGAIDKSHTVEWTADDFHIWLSEKFVGFNAQIIEHNTFDNAFSFNTVLRRV